MPKFNIADFLQTQMSKIPPNFNLKFLIYNLKVTGGWPPINGNKICYAIWSIFAFTISLGHLIFAQTGFIVAAEWVDTEGMASALSLLINNYVHLLKLSVVFFRQNRIQALLDYAEARKFVCDDREMMKKLEGKFSRSAFMHYANFQFAGLAACTGWILSSAVKSLKDENHRIFPMNAWYGYDATVSPIYEITLVFQSVGVCICCVQNISLDGLIIGFMAVIGCEFEILKTRITEIGNDVVRVLDATEYTTTNILKRKDIDERLYNELMACVEHHLAIISYTKEFEKIFHSAIFLQFLDNCCVICMTAFALSQLREYNLTTILGNMMYLTAIIYQLFMYCYFGNIVSIQVFNIFWRQDRIRSLLDVVKSDEFSRYNSQYESISTSYTLRGILHHIAYQSFGAVAVFCWGFSPIADYMSGHNRRLPMEAWYPYNVTETPAFELTCVHQTLAVVFACFQNVAMDTLVTGLLTVACCQLEFLKSNLRLIGTEPLTSRKNAFDELRNFVQHHNAIINFTKEIEAIFSTTIILQFLVNSVIICLNAFHITKMKEFVPAQLIGMTMYTCCMTYQIFIYCWHGNEIVLQSESVVFAAYAGNWWKCGERYKRGLRLLMARAKEPLTLKAGNLLTLSLQTFVTILRASYSFFTVLQSSTDKTVPA